MEHIILAEADKSRFIDKMGNLTDEQKSRFKSALKYDTNLENIIYKVLGDWQKSSDWTWGSIEPYVLKAEAVHEERIEKDKKNLKVALEQGVDYNVFYEDDNFTVYEILTYPAMCVIASNEYEPQLEAEIPYWAWDRGDINEWCEEANEEGKPTASGAHWCVALKRDRSHWEEYANQYGYHMYVGCKTHAHEDDPFGKICFFNDGDGIEVWDANDGDHDVDSTGDWFNLLNRLSKKIKGVGDENAYFKAFPEDEGKEKGYISFCEDLKNYGIHAEFQKTTYNIVVVTIRFSDKDMKESLHEVVDKVLGDTGVDWRIVSIKDSIKVEAWVITDRIAKVVRKELDALLRHCRTTYAKDGRDWVEEACATIGEEFDTHVTPLGEFDDYTETELNTDDFLKGDVDLKATAVIDKKDDGEFEFSIRVVGEFKNWEEEFKDLKGEYEWVDDCLDVFEGGDDDIMFVYFLSPSSNPREDCKRVFTVIKTILDEEQK